MSDTNPPEKTGSNKLHEGIGQFLRSCTGPASPLVSLIWPSFHQKEVEKWRNTVHLELEELGEKYEVFRLDNLRDNPEFTSILIQATQIATRNFQQEKLTHLRNVIINTPITPPSPDLKLTFVNFIDELSVNQIKILSLLHQHDETKTIESYPKLLSFFQDNHGLALSNHEFKMYMVGLETRGLIRISKDFDDFEDEVYISSKLLLEDGEHGVFNFILVLDTGVALLDFITQKDGY
jgi:hypothetical protein